MESAYYYALDLRSLAIIDEGNDWQEDLGHACTNHPGTTRDMLHKGRIHRRGSRLPSIMPSMVVVISSQRLLANGSWEMRLFVYGMRWSNIDSLLLYV
jgi:hypothetical protein